MLVSQVEDLVRARLGVPDLAPSMLEGLRMLARSDVEAMGRFYWQADHVDITLPTAVDSFLVEVDWQALNFSEFRFIQIQKGGKWRTIFPGSWLSTFEGVTVTATGCPERAVYENKTLKLSPIPDQDYQARVHFFASTDEPASVSDTDTLYTDFPQIMLYATLMLGERLVKNNMEASIYWGKLLQDQVDSATEYTRRLLGEPVAEISPSTAAKILQAAGAGK